MRQKNMFPVGSLKTWGSIPSMRGGGLGRKAQTSVADGWRVGSGSPELETVSLDLGSNAA